MKLSKSIILLFPNNESTILFVSFCSIILADSLFVIVGLVLLLFLGRGMLQFRFITCYIFFSIFCIYYFCLWIFSVCWICRTSFIIFSYLPLDLPVVDYFFILLYFWRDYWIFVTRYVWELNILIMLIHIYWMILLIFGYKKGL